MRSAPILSNKEGAYLARKSEDNTYELLVHHEGAVETAIIDLLEDGSLECGGRRFPSVAGVVDGTRRGALTLRNKAGNIIELHSPVSVQPGKLCALDVNHVHDMINCSNLFNRPCAQIRDTRIYPCHMMHIHITHNILIL